jgi:hypothetical protein
LGETCYIQQYLDHHPGPSVRDFACGPLSYNGHDGTDIALPSRAAMGKGVAVLAAAPGTVKGARDGIADFAPTIPDKECGNGVLVDHGGGWETQYCHLKQGSLRVGVGDAVIPGTVLGQIGQSGMADFPHLHLSVRKNGVELDPFAPDATVCGPAGPSLWQDPIAYVPGGLLSVGLTSAVPEYDQIKAGLDSPDLPENAPALVAWAFVYGAQAGDALIFEVTGPEGKIITERVVFKKPQAQAFRATGRKLRGTGWPAGPYSGTVKFLRVARLLGEKDITLSVVP